LWATALSLLQTSQQQQVLQQQQQQQHQSQLSVAVASNTMASCYQQLALQHATSAAVGLVPLHAGTFLVALLNLCH
jgi:uncharacterized membrane-anchored protein